MKGSGWLLLALVLAFFYFHEPDASTSQCCNRGRQLAQVEWQSEAECTPCDDEKLRTKAMSISGTLAPVSKKIGGGVFKNLNAMPDPEKHREQIALTIERLQRPVEANATEADEMRHWVLKQMEEDPRFAVAIGDAWAGRREQTVAVAIVGTCGTRPSNR